MKPKQGKAIVKMVGNFVAFYSPLSHCLLGMTWEGSQQTPDFSFRMAFILAEEVNKNA
jgi:hypothetical protein